MAVACAGRQSPHQRRRAGRERPRPHQRRAREIAGTPGEAGRRRHHRARYPRAGPESVGAFRVAVAVHCVLSAAGIDCGLWQPECPADAIKPDTEPGLEKWLEVNTEYAKTWPNITQKKDSPEEAKSFEGQEGKFEKYFSPNPGTGD